MCVCCHFLLQALFEEGEAVKFDPRVESVNCTFSAKCCSVVCGVVSAKLIVVDSWPWLIPDSFHVLSTTLDRDKFGLYRPDSRHGGQLLVMG